MSAAPVRNVMLESFSDTATPKRLALLAEEKAKAEEARRKEAFDQGYEVGYALSQREAEETRGTAIDETADVLRGLAEDVAALTENANRMAAIAVRDALEALLPVLAEKGFAMEAAAEIVHWLGTAPAGPLQLRVHPDLGQSVGDALEQLPEDDRARLLLVRDPALARLSVQLLYDESARELSLERPLKRVQAVFDRLAAPVAPATAEVEVKAEAELEAAPPADEPEPATPSDQSDPQAASTIPAGPVLRSSPSPRPENVSHAHDEPAETSTVSVSHTRPDGVTNE
ncbi:MAG: hypothetical protein AAFV62_00190 [Pseudomonadota bacterium]